ncbi:hypothetical protein SEPCBS119000_006104 [Sporothrix epigloea]|uniref:Methyltransferase domain-containing protein n=1 Tax=Sporothrix epigloea TaxID=1892477 RepID=A0ABP0E165_9PEZI
MSFPPPNPHARIKSLGSCIPLAGEATSGSRHGSGSIQGTPSGGRSKIPTNTASSLTAEEHGRHFLVNSHQYLFPWDLVEARRMDLFHKAVSLLRGQGTPSNGLHSAPLRPDQHLRILDLGTGTGLWVVEMADHYAGRSEVWGVDLAPFQPHLIPSNAKFQRLDIETQWQLGTASWDLIHIRCLNGAVRSWPSLYATVCSHLIPGVGHIEHLEIDWIPLKGAGPHLVEWSRTLLDCMDRAGRPLRVNSDTTTKALKDAGFGSVQVSRFHVPLSAKRDVKDAPRPTTPRALITQLTGTEIGHVAENEALRDNKDGAKVWFPSVFAQWLEGLTLKPMLLAGYSLEAVYHLLASVRQELEDPSIQAECTM